ncbi:class I tRNA ligase family protein [Nonomuraea sp. NPDC048916]|uniref:class I tRNA ligase family protein n=1 Tax=Nonomuraea sp. NPDC048916 TaxID=3154232 RepID=UPI0033FE44E6
MHDYLTAGGRKISKSSGVTVDPVALVHAYGVDAVRWWLLREVPRVGDFDFRRAAAAVWAIVEQANRYVEHSRPWRQPPEEREVSLATLVRACRTLAVQLEPFLPTAAARVAAGVSGTRLARPEPIFPRLGG